MTYPVDLSTVTLHATYIDAATGNLLNGKVTFTPDREIANALSTNVLVRVPYDVPVVNGEMTVTLPVTNDPQYSPVFSYLVTEDLNGVINRDPYLIAIDASLAGTTVQLASLQPVVPGSSVVNYVPVTGGTMTGDLVMRDSAATAGTVRIGNAADQALGGGSSSNVMDVRSTDPAVGAGFFKHNPVGGTATTHALTARQAATSGSGTGSALNVTSDNTGFSAAQISGKENDRGTLKISHVNNSGSASGDAAAAALSIDLQKGSMTGTAAQGIFITSTTGATTGNLVTVRNNGREDFVVKATGRVGVGIATAATPGGMLAIQQTDDTSKGLFVKANSAAALGLIEGQDSSGNVVGNLSPAGDLYVSGKALGDVHPRDHNLIAWSYDPIAAVNSTVLTAGVQYLVSVYVPLGQTATKIYWHVAVAGATPTAGQNEVSIYDSSGNRLAFTNVDADISSTGVKTTTVSSTSLLGGRMYYLSFIFNATTVPALSRTTGLAAAGALVNVGLAAASYRFATNGTGKTSSPASITLASNAQGIPLWAAVGP